MIVEVWLKCSASWVYKDIINYVFTEPYVYKFFLSAQKKKFVEILFYAGINIKQNHCTKMKLFIKEFHSFLGTWSHLLKRCSIENSILCAVNCNKLVKPVSVKYVKKIVV